RVQGRAQVQFYRGQLGRVPDQDQFTVVSRLYVLDQVVQKGAVAEEFGVRRAVRNHGGLVHDEQGVPVLVGGQDEFDRPPGPILGKIDFFVDGKGLSFRIDRHDLGRPP